MGGRLAMDQVPVTVNPRCHYVGDSAAGHPLTACVGQGVLSSPNAAREGRGVTEARASWTEGQADGPRGESRWSPSRRGNRGAAPLHPASGIEALRALGEPPLARSPDLR